MLRGCFKKVASGRHTGCARAFFIPSPGASVKKSQRNSASESKSTTVTKRAKASISVAAGFDGVLTLIQAARLRTAAEVNKTLIELYWSIGRYISEKIVEERWGQGTVEGLADHIQRTLPNARGYSGKESLADDAIFRGVSVPTKTVKTVDRIVLEPQSCHFGACKAR
jgi:hypothetical protein